MGRPAGRPKVPLISKRRSLEVALRIIDQEGIEALSIRTLADRLEVNGASLYYHFRNKEEILVGVAKLALEEVRVPQGHEEPWRFWLVRNARRMRAAFRTHPDLAPIMMRREPLGIGASQLDATVVHLEAEGVPIGAIGPMLRGLERYAVSSALQEADQDQPGGDARPANLERADREAAVTADEVFDLVCNQIIDTVLGVAAGRASTPRPHPPEPAPAPKRATA